MHLSRRDVLKLGLLGSAALVLPLERVARTQLAQAARLPTDRLPLPFTRWFTTPPVMRPITKTLKDGRVVDFYDMVQREVSLPILGPGYPPTTIWGYNGMTPGPTIQVNKGREVVFCQSNALPDRHPTLGYEPRTSTHLHGSASLPQFDGYASDVT